MPWLHRWPIESRAWLELILLLISCGIAQAHSSSESYLTLRMQEAGLDARWDIPLVDLNNVAPLDEDGDGLVTWGEVKSCIPSIERYALERLRLSTAGRVFALTVTNRLVTLPFLCGLPGPGVEWIPCRSPNLAAAAGRRELSFVL